MNIPPTAADWAKATEAQKKESFRLYKGSGLLAGLLAGSTMGPIGAVIGGIGGFLVGAYIHNKNLPKN